MSVRVEFGRMAMRKTIQALAFGLVALSAAPAVAQDATAICLNAGHQYQVGDYACLPGCHGRQRYARCDALGTNASWTYISEVCPIAVLSPPEPRGTSMRPVVTAMSPIPYSVTMSAIAPEIEERIRDIGRLASR
jgi:hypothetical protein